MITIAVSDHDKPIVLNDRQVGDLVFSMRKDGKFVVRCEHPYGACKHCGLLKELMKAKGVKRYIPEDECPFHGRYNKRNDYFGYDPNRDGFWDYKANEDENVFEID